jgi:outer membrane protein W
MRLTTRFRMETGLSFAAIDRILANRIDKTVNIYQPCKLNIPLTIQYQFGSDKKRLRPYFGAGVQYTQQIISSNGETGISRDANDYYNRSLSNTVKYMNIIFTQGIIYDINPNLQVSQSLHIMPHASGFKPIGINIGVGYRIR